MEIPKSGSAPTQVARNIERVRKARQLKQKDVSDRLRAVGRPILATVISKIERGERRVDTDDVIAFALAMNVSPLTLLLPPEGDSVSTVHVTAEVAAKADRVWAWGRGDETLPPLWENADPQKQEEFEQLALPAALRYGRAQPAGRATEVLRSDVFRMLEFSQIASDTTGVDEEFKRRLSLARESLARLGHELDRAEVAQADLARRHQERRAHQGGTTDGDAQ
ncbi:helix-turn-helix domain-containing protein [Streptomyces sp. NPDC001502]|uniref:helix-turn-helix domain-containing protein n=1 Tax=Streptomyces sp. NPDC001502 TaxID=3364578 RepID=UPI0036AD5BFB